MSNRLTRRQFAFTSSATVFTGLAAVSAAARQKAPSQPPAQPLTQPATKPAAGGFDKGPPLDLELNRQVVGFAHRDLAKVMELVNADPELVNAVWDWGGGDFETPLGAAAHTGQREIAEFLLKNNARMDVFAAAMLGKLDVVKAAIAADPMVRFTLGPHAITLVRHADAGGDEAAAVMAYLKELEAADRESRDLPLSSRAVRRYLGTFRQEGEASSAVHEFAIVDRRLTWKRDGTSQSLAHLGNHRFVTESGYNGSLLTFKIRKNQGQVVDIQLGGNTTSATRVV